MKAVIKTGGKQYLVSEGDQIKIEKLDKEEGSEVTFSDVFLIGDQIGTPVVKGAKVIGKILKQDKHDKIIVFKFKPKKRYKVKKGHRQPYTLVEIKSLSV